MGKIKKVLIVSPHSDDALFSCAHALLGDGFEAQVLTVENNPKRIAEDKKLYEFLAIPFHHLKVEFDDQSFYEYHKRYKDFDHDVCLEYLIEYFGEKKLDEIATSLFKFLREFKRKNPDYLILAPFGQSHPFHYFIYWVLLDKADFFYREFPHSYKKRAQQQLRESLKNFVLYKSIPTVDIHDVKFELAKKFYKTQSGLLWFEQGYIKKMLPEELYIKK